METDDPRSFGVPFSSQEFQNEAQPLPSPCSRSRMPFLCCDTLRLASRADVGECSERVEMNGPWPNQRFWRHHTVLFS